MRLRSTAILASTAVLVLTACDKPAPPANTAEAPAAPATATTGTPEQKFAAEINAVGDELAAHSQKNAENRDPMSAMKGGVAILRKLENVKTDGLPEDLATSFKTMRSAVSAIMDDLEKLPADMPKNGADLGEYISKHPDFAPVYASLEQKSAAIVTAQDSLKTAAEKHKLDLTPFLKGGSPQ